MRNSIGIHDLCYSQVDLLVMIIMEWILITLEYILYILVYQN